MPIASSCDEHQCACHSIVAALQPYLEASTIQYARQLVAQYNGATIPPHRLLPKPNIALPPHLLVAIADVSREPDVRANWHAPIVPPPPTAAELDTYYRAQLPAGWYRPGSARGWHYFDAQTTRSLCDKFSTSPFINTRLQCLSTQQSLQACAKCRSLMRKEGIALVVADD